MYDFTLDMQIKQRINEIRRETERRHWLRDALNHLSAARAERAARRSRSQRDHGEHN